MDEYRSFYEEQKDKLFAYLMRMTGDYYLSSDIMQESFTRYLEHYGREAQSTSLLYTIARNALFDNAGRRANNPLFEAGLEDCSRDQENVLMIREEYRRVLSAMQRLDKSERDILALVVAGEFTYRKIALIAGISEANVKVKVHRARRKLKEILQTGEL